MNFHPNELEAKAIKALRKPALQALALRMATELRRRFDETCPHCHRILFDGRIWGQSEHFRHDDYGVWTCTWCDGELPGKPEKKPADLWPVC